MNSDQIQAEIRFPTQKLRDDLPFYTKTLGMQLEMIFPADDPRVAVLSGHGIRIRIEKDAPEQPGTIRLLTDAPENIGNGKSELVAPNGTRIEVAPLSLSVDQPETIHEFTARHFRDNAPWVIGRAGMNYRDLVPSRLGGAIIASHIRIPGGGVIPDITHYHTVGFQLIFCYKGWVDVAYEDQGDELMRLTAGDCVIQPPEIRHRVCLASPDIEVIEIGVPAEHITTIDPDMIIPNGFGNPDREWQGQKFVHHVKDEAEWQDFRIPGFSCRETGINAGTKGVASIQVAKYIGGDVPASSHDTDILFYFVMEGSMTLESEGHAPHKLETGDAFVVPPETVTRYCQCSKDLELLEASLPGTFNTTLL